MNLGPRLAPEAALLLAMCLVAALVVLFILRRRGDSRRELQTRFAELQALSNAVSAIASAKLDEDALCHLVYDQAARLVDVSNFQLGLFENNHYHIKLRYAHGVQQPAAQFDLSETGGIVGWVRDTRQPLIVHDFETEADRLPAKPRYVSANPPRSAVFVPMTTSEAVIGAIAIQSERVSAYTDTHLRMLSIIANQAAAAIQNARALRLERTRATQMELVSEVSRSTASLFELPSLLPKLVQAIQSTFDYYFVGIFLVDELAQIECVAASLESLVGSRRKKGIGLVGTAIAEGRQIIVGDTRADKRFLFEPSMPNALSEAVLPLKISDRVIGALDLESDRERAFSDEDARYLEVLAQQVAIAVEDARLYQASLERNQLEQELNFAREIQTSFLPKVTPAVEGWSIAGGWQAARQVGGDFYDFIQIEPDDWGIVIADVADKGVPAALFMVMSRTLMRAVAISGRAPAKALIRVNHLIQSDSAADLFVTMLYARWDACTGRVTYSNAGHNPPLLCTQGEVQVCRSRGMALGIADQIVVDSNEIMLQAGDVLLLYTDGFTDALNSDYEEFGMVRLQTALQAAHHLDAAGIVAALQKAVGDFAGDEPTFDDQTLVVIKRNPQ